MPNKIKLTNKVMGYIVLILLVIISVYIFGFADIERLEALKSYFNLLIGSIVTILGGLMGFNIYQNRKRDGGE